MQTKNRKGKKGMSETMNIKLENAKQLTGKRTTCLGCNKLEIANFERC